MEAMAAFIVCRSGQSSCTGTSGTDSIFGTDGSDNISGLEGADAMLEVVAIPSLADLAATAFSAVAVGIL